ncbi:MAG: tetratricopeptide repeat protein, partial [Myxococcales bacterium]
AADRAVFGVEVEPGSLENTLAKVRDELGHWVKKGRYTKVRFKFRGKAILPDLPIGAVLAANAVSFWWAGLLRALLATLGATAVLDVELVNDSAREVARGKDHLLAGDLDEAIAAFNRAVEMDRDCAAGYLNLGVAYRLKMERETAISWLERAARADPEGPSGAEAQRLLKQMGVKPPEPAAAAGSTGA